MQVTAFWEALDVPAGRYKVFLHLVDATGQLVAQYDEEPGDGMDPTSDWHPVDGVFSDRYGAWVPQTLAGGEYRLWLGLYDISGTPRLPVSIEGESAGDAFSLAIIEIQ